MERINSGVFLTARSKHLTMFSRGGGLGVVPLPTKMAHVGRLGGANCRLLVTAGLKVVVCGPHAFGARVVGMRDPDRPLTRIGGVCASSFNVM